MKRSTAAEVAEHGTLIRVTTPYVVASVIIYEGKVRRAAPKLDYAIGWTRVYFYEHAALRGWKLERVDNRDDTDGLK